MLILCRLDPRGEFSVGYLHRNINGKKEQINNQQSKLDLLMQSTQKTLEWI